MSARNFEPEYCTIAEASEQSKHSVHALLQLGAANRLAIYAQLPALPLVKYDTSEFPENRMPFGNLLTTSGLVRMITFDVATIEAGGDAQCHVFEKVDFATGKTCRYRVSDDGPGRPLDEYGKGSVTVRLENLRIMASDIEAIKRRAESAESKPKSETPAQRRKNHDITKERGCRRLILEHWDSIEKAHGPNADGRQARNIIIKHVDASERKPVLKTVQNHLAALRKEKLIP